MATYTKNYNLIKPAPEDFGDVADLNANADKVDEVLKKKADLDAGGKLPAEQLPTLSYIPNNQKGTANGVATLDGNRKVPAAQIPALDYIPTSQKGTAGGVATLGADGKIPESQLGAVGVPPQIIVTVPSGSAVTCKSGSKTLSATSTGTVTFALPAYGTWTVTATLNGQTAAENVVVDDVKQYRLSLAYFSATLRVTSESGATVTATGPKTVSGTVPSNGVLDLKITAPALTRSPLLSPAKRPRLFPSRLPTPARPIPQSACSSTRFSQITPGRRSARPLPPVKPPPFGRWATRRISASTARPSPL